MIRLVGSSIGARVYRTTDLVLGNGANPSVDFDAEAYDDANFHSLITNPSRLTAPVSGRYQITCNAHFAFVNGTGVRSVAIRLDGGDIGGQINTASAGNSTYVTATVTTSMNAGQYIEMAVYQNSGGNLNLLSNTTSPICSIQKVS